MSDKNSKKTKIPSDLHEEDKETLKEFIDSGADVDIRDEGDHLVANITNLDEETIKFIKEYLDIPDDEN